MGFIHYMQELSWLFLLLTILFATLSYFLWRILVLTRDKVGIYVVIDNMSLKDPISFRNKGEAINYCRLANIRTSKGVIRRYEVMTCRPLNTVTL
jgi:hypothetical protein